MPEGRAMKSHALAWLVCCILLGGTELASQRKLVSRPGLYHSLTEPPCSYGSTQNRKSLIRPDDRVIACARADKSAALPRGFHGLTAARPES